MTRESAIKRSVLQFAVTSAVVLLVVAREEVVGALSPRGLGIVGLLLWVGGFVFLTLRLRTINRNYKPAEEFALGSNDLSARKKVMRNIRLSQGGMIAMVLCLLNGLFNGRDAPWGAIAVGVAANLALTWLFFKAYRVQRAKLRHLDQITVVEPVQTTIKVENS
jgi:hypothetical protein